MSVLLSFPAGDSKGNDVFLPSSFTPDIWSHFRMTHDDGSDPPLRPHPDDSNVINEQCSRTVAESGGPNGDYFVLGSM